MSQLFSRSSRRRGRKRQQEVQDAMQQLKAAHNVKLMALQSQRKAQLMTVLCCLQLARPRKPYLPQPVAKIANMVHNKTEQIHKHRVPAF